MNKKKKGYIMKRTEIPCPACYDMVFSKKPKVIQETETTSYCDECGQRYTNEKGKPNTLKYG
jgi:uncharacterized Zn finger protein